MERNEILRQLDAAEKLWVALVDHHASEADLRAVDATIDLYHRALAAPTETELKMANAGYIRQLEDAALTLWAELPAAEARELRAEMPHLMDFLGHLHQRVEHEQAMVRQNVWAEPLLPTRGGES
jgi:hypothetical protein